MLIERKQGSGTFGTVNVAYATLAPSESYPFLPSLDPTMRRADYDDYDYVSGIVTFVLGQTDALVNVSVKGTNQSRPDSVVFLRLNYIILVQPQQPRPGLCTALMTITAERIAYIQVYIPSPPIDIICI